LVNSKGLRYNSWVDDKNVALDSQISVTFDNGDATDKCTPVANYLKPGIFRVNC